MGLYMPHFETVRSRLRRMVQLLASYDAIAMSLAEHEWRKLVLPVAPSIAENERGEPQWTAERLDRLMEDGRQAMQVTSNLILEAMQAPSIEVARLQLESAEVRFELATSLRQEIIQESVRRAARTQERQEPFSSKGEPASPLEFALVAVWEELLDLMSVAEGELSLDPTTDDEEEEEEGGVFIRQEAGSEFGAGGEAASGGTSDAPDEEDE